MKLVLADSLEVHGRQPIGWASRMHHQEQHRIHRAYAHWLGARHWDHYVDLTSAMPLTEDQLLHVFEYQWIRWLEKSAQVPVLWAVFAQKGRAFERDHLHCLLHGTASLTGKQIGRAWQPGRIVKVRRYDPTKGAAGYITRDVLNDAEWNISRRLPPERAVALETDGKLRNS